MNFACLFIASKQEDGVFMKFSKIVMVTITAVLFTGCFSTGSSTFSSAKKVSSGNMIISTDEFEGTTFIEHKDIGVDFTEKSWLYMSGLGFYIEPVFSTAEDYVMCFLKIRTTAMGRNNSFKCSKLIFLSDFGKVTVNIKSNPTIEANSDFMNDYTETIYLEKISMTDYERFTEFILNSQKIRLGFYSDNNEAVELKEYGDRAHDIFNNAYSYYKVNLQSKTDTAIHANQLIWK